MLNIKKREVFLRAKSDQFSSVVNSPEAKGRVLNALQEYGYRIQKLGDTTHCLKGRAIISFEGSNYLGAMVTPLKPC